MSLDASRCYRALTTRDRRFDGRFYTAVLTTGIYCRPVCPARTPRPENVRFFPCAAAAEEAGFRPCLRCRPETAPGTPAWAGSSAVVTRALRLIDEGALDAEDLPTFSARLGVGERQLTRLFTTQLGVAPGALARTRRTELARRLLDETGLPITQISGIAGFSSLRQFHHAMRQRFGEAPGALRARRRRPPDSPDGAPIRLRLAYRPPFDAASLLSFLAARAIPGVEHVDETSYRRTVRTAEGAGTLLLRPVADAAHVELHLDLPRFDGLAALVTRARRVFDLDADPLAIATQLRGVPALAACVATRPGLRVPGSFDPFELAVRAVLGQQVSVRGATTLSGRLVARVGTKVARAHDPALTHLFPTAEELAEADLSCVGLPQSRAEAIRALATAVAKGAVAFDGTLGLEERVARLEALPGIGPWTAHYIAMRACGEPDAFPAGDLVLRRALSPDGKPLSSRALERAAEVFRPWRAYAALHLWTQGAST